MAHQKKMDKVGEYVDTRLRIRVPILYNKQSHEHVAEYAGQKLTHAEYREVERMVAAKVKSTADLHWFAVIGVDAQGLNSGYSGVSLRVHRFVLARHMNGIDVLSSEWDVADIETEFPYVRYKGLEAPLHARLHASKNFWHKPEDKNVKIAEENLPLRLDNDEVLLPYSEQRWDALRHLQKQLDFVSSKLNELLKTPAGIAALDRTDSFLPGLPAPSPSDGKDEANEDGDDSDD